MPVGPGTLLEERYLVEEELGSGGMGAVWRGHDTRLGRKVAVKVLRSDDPDPQLIARFSREARILASLNHPGITVVHDTGRHDGQFFIVMELHEGSDLAEILAGYGGLPVARTVDLALQAAQALAAAHRKDVVHRDIKPGNLFIVASDRLKVCDFGIAKRVDSDWTRTQPGLVMGTPAYMSPEQCRSADAVDERSDLYSLGCVMYEMLTGRPPFGRGNDWSRVDRGRWGIPPEPPHGVEPVPPELSALILSMVERDRDKRPPSASAVAQTLQEIKNALAGGQRRQQQRPEPDAPGARPRPGDPPRNAPPPAADPPGHTPPQQVTAAELRAMGPKVAAAYLEEISSPAAAAKAVNGLAAYEAAAILKLLSHSRAAALLTALGEPVHAARILAALDPQQQAAIVASFREPKATGLIFDAVPPSTVARLAAALEERFLARALVVMDRDHALKVLDAMDIARRRVVIAHLPSTGDARVLRDLAEARLQEAEQHISAAAAQAQVQAARRRREADLMPWTASVAGSAALLAATTVAFDVGAAALNWESWPWLFLFIPATLTAAGGAIAALSARYTAVGRPAVTTAMFLAASVCAVLLVTHVMAGVAGVPVVAVTPLIGIALVVAQLSNEGEYLLNARRVEQRGRRARDGDDGSS